MLVIKTQNRFIKTKIPAPGTYKIIKSLQKSESRSMQGQLPIIWSKAEGHSLVDIGGNKFIDFTSTIFVANIGHSNNNLIKNLKKALDKKLLHSYAYFNSSREKYLKNLVKFAGKNFEKAFLMSAGTEATEAALKLMRLYGQKVKKRKLGIICIDGNWHGRTMGAQMMSGNKEQKEWIGYEDKNIHHIKFPYPWELKKSTPKEFLNKCLEKLKKKIDLKKDICGFMLETFQGWGAIFYPKEFVKEISKLCKQNKILLTFDEMQAGFGRTGELFGYMHYGVTPDLIACGKGSSSSLPLSLVLGSKKIMDLPGTDSMSSTHSANPMVCAAGLANMQAILEDGLIDNSKILGEYFHLKLNEIKNKHYNYISHINGKGLLAAVIFSKDSIPLSNLCDLISEKCMQKGLIVVHTGRESIKLAPSLTITKEALIEGIQVFEECIKESIFELYPY